MEVIVKGLPIIILFGLAFGTGCTAAFFITIDAIKKRNEYERKHHRGN